nr:hypothetical protein [Tanacetum cinerariifolium]
MEKHESSSRLWNDADANDAYIKPVYDEEPMVEVQLTAKNNVFATGQHPIKQPKFNNEGEVDQNVKQCHDILVRQPTVFKFERPRISKPRFASQVDVNNDLPKPVTTHYFPRERESAFEKPHHMITLSSSRYSSNDMVHNHYLEEDKKKTQESGKNSRPSVMPSARSQSIANGSKPKPRINNQNSRNWHLSKSSGFLQERYSNLAQPRLTVNPHIVLIQISLISMNAYKLLIPVQVNVIYGRPRLHGIASLQEIAARPSS